MKKRNACLSDAARENQSPHINQSPKASGVLRGLGGRRQLGRDGREGRAQLGAESAQSADEDDSDESGDQAIFNGGGAGFVLQEARDKLGHGDLL